MTALGSTFGLNPRGQAPSRAQNFLGTLNNMVTGLDDFAYENQLGQYGAPQVISNGADVGAYNQALEGAYAPYQEMMARREQLSKRRQEREQKRKFQGALGSVYRTGGFAGELEPYKDILMTAESPEELAYLGKVFQSQTPESTANIREYQLAQQDPAFMDFLDKRGAREPSGTEAIIGQLMQEDPNLSYYQALAVAQGLARKGLEVRGGSVVPMSGTPEALGSLSKSQEMGTLEAQQQMVADIEREKVRGKARGEAETELADYQAFLPKLQDTVSRLDQLAQTATYTKAGQLWAATQKELGNEVSQADIDRAAYIATIDNEVLPLLRQTFGAAFTQKEGETLKATLGSPDATPAQKKAALNAFIQNKTSQIEAQKSKVGILGGGQTPTGRKRFNPQTGAFE